MTIPQPFRLIAVATSVLLLGTSGCGFSSTTARPETTTQAHGTIPEYQEVASVESSVPAEKAIAEAPSTQDAPEPKQTNRNPFRPPTVKSRTVTPQQAESGDIRLLGIAKRDSQYIALLEAAGDFHKAVVGDYIEEWEVLSVTDSETTLRRGLEQMSLRIR
ncbi:hypothetical protein [Bremerella sp.]|uniref:hypothetical protein n=1 Tax=Bremerella sp. TaxID=2795602 RepID=UPI003918EA44